MTIICPKCGNAVETPYNIVEGQHVQCPYCGEKFEYHAQSEYQTAATPKPPRKINGKVIVYGLRILACICCFLSVQQFLSGWLNLPDFDSGWWLGNEYSGSQARVCESTMRVAVISIGKMFAGYFFAKVSRRFWRMTK